MHDKSKLIVQAESPDQIIKTLDMIYPMISREDRRRISRLQAVFLATFDFEGLWMKVNGRSIENVLSMCDEFSVSVEVEGEVQGMKYRLLDGSGPDEIDE